MLSLCGCGLSILKYSMFLLSHDNSYRGILLIPIPVFVAQVIYPDMLSPFPINPHYLHILLSRKKSKLLNALILKSLISSFFSIFLIPNSIKKNTHRLHAIKILVTRKTPESSIQILFTMYVPTDAK